MVLGGTAASTALIASGMPAFPDGLMSTPAAASHPGLCWPQPAVVRSKLPAHNITLPIRRCGFMIFLSLIGQSRSVRKRQSSIPLPPFKGIPLERMPPIWSGSEATLTSNRTICHE